MFKPSSDTWKCPTCLSECLRCSSQRPESSKADIQANTSSVFPTKDTGVKSRKEPSENNEALRGSSIQRLSSLFQKPPGDWVCPTCSVLNKEHQLKCFACDKPKPGAKPVPSNGAISPAPTTGPNVFGQPAAVTAPGLFNFGARSNAPSNPAGIFTLSAKPSHAASKPDVMPSFSQLGSKRSMDDDGVGSKQGRSGSEDMPMQEVDPMQSPKQLSVGFGFNPAPTGGYSSSGASKAIYPGKVVDQPVVTPSKKRCVERKNTGEPGDGPQIQGPSSDVTEDIAKATVEGIVVECGGYQATFSHSTVPEDQHLASQYGWLSSISRPLSSVVYRTSAVPCSEMQQSTSRWSSGPSSASCSSSTKWSAPMPSGYVSVERIYPSPSELETEVQTNVQCPVVGCLKTFRRPSALRLHRVKLHRQIVTEGDARLAKHLKPEPEKECRYYCPDSNCRFNGLEYFKSVKKLKQHFMRLHSQRKLGCSICGKKYGLGHDLQRHKTQCRLKPWCLSCNVRMGSLAILTQHLSKTGHKGLDGQCFEDVNSAEMPDQHSHETKECSDITAVGQVSTTVSKKQKRADRKKSNQDTRPRTILPAPTFMLAGPPVRGQVTLTFAIIKKNTEMYQSRQPDHRTVSRTANLDQDTDKSSTYAPMTYNLPSAGPSTGTQAPGKMRREQTRKHYSNKATEKEDETASRGSNLPSLSSLFQNPPADWVCATFSVPDKDKQLKRSACDKPKLGATPVPSNDAISPAPMTGSIECTNHDNPSGQEAAKPSLFNKPAATNIFQFGQQPQQPQNTAAGGLFQFGASSKPMMMKSDRKPTEDVEQKSLLGRFGSTLREYLIPSLPSFLRESSWQSTNAVANDSEEDQTQQAVTGVEVDRIKVEDTGEPGDGPQIQGP